MKVGNTPDITSPEIPRHREVRPAQSGPSTVDTSDTADTLAISKADKLTQAPESAEVRADKIASIKAAIDDGSFKIDPGVVASRIINETASLLESLSGMSETPTAANQQTNAQQSGTQNSQEKFGAGPANQRSANPDS